MTSLNGIKLYSIYLTMYIHYGIIINERGVDYDTGQFQNR